MSDSFKNPDWRAGSNFVPSGIPILVTDENWTTDELCIKGDLIRVYESPDSRCSSTGVFDGWDEDDDLKLKDGSIIDPENIHSIQVLERPAPESESPKSKTPYREFPNYTLEDELTFIYEEESEKFFVNCSEIVNFEAAINGIMSAYKGFVNNDVSATVQLVPFEVCGGGSDLEIQVSSSGAIIVSNDSNTICVRITDEFLMWAVWKLYNWEHLELEDPDTEAALPKIAQPPAQPTVSKSWI